MAVRLDKKHNLDDGDHYRRDRLRGYKTRNIVKGMDGGIRGADYTSLQKQHIEELDGAAMRNLRASMRAENLARTLGEAAAQQAIATTGAGARRGAKGADLAHVDALDLQNVVNPLAAQAVIEQVPPAVQLEDERLKKKLLLLDWDDAQDELDQEEDEAAEDEVEEVGPFADNDVDALLEAVDNEQLLRLVRDPQVEMRIYGTVRLIKPEDMRAALGTPLRVARHLRVIAERMLGSDAFTREEVVQYIAGCLLHLGLEFGGSALRSFCYGVGVGAVYPLEVVERVVELAPPFLPKTTICPFMIRRRQLQLRAGKAFTLRIDPALKITGFALKGGGEPGYQFAPRKDPGEFGICFLTPGTFTLLLSAIDPYGFERIQELKVLVRDPADAPVAKPEPPARAAPAAPAAPKKKTLAKYLKKRRES